MSYSIKAELEPFINKDGLSKIAIVVRHNRQKHRAITPYKVKPEQFINNQVTGHSNAKNINKVLNDRRVEIEGRLIDALAKTPVLSKDEIKQIINGQTATKDKLVEFIDELVDEKLWSSGYSSHAVSLGRHIEMFTPGIRFNQVNLEWIAKFQAWYKKRPGRLGKPLSQNTLHSRMKTLMNVFGIAESRGKMSGNQFSGHKVPTYTQGIPDYIDDEEMEAWLKMCEALRIPGQKRAGYYYLLGCYAGYRISDLSVFSYREKVRGDQIVVRAQKNGKIVPMFIHSRLKVVLEFCKDHPLNLSEQKFRDYVHNIAKSLGIARKITIHTSRHSFGMLLARSGFTLDEAALLLGDSRDTAKIYFRIENNYMKEKVKERLG